MTRHEVSTIGSPGAPLIGIDTESPVPPYEQIRAQLAALIISGLLAAGTKLPPIRQLAADLDLAPGTVARAYRALDHAGLTTGRVRTGTTVARQQQPHDGQALERLDAAARTYAATIRALGLTRAQAITALIRNAGDLPTE